MRTLRVLAGAVLLATLAGCAVGVGPYPPYGPPVVVTDGGDYWFDGVNTYYFEPGIGYYYYYYFGGARRYCAPGWSPRPEWGGHHGGFDPGRGRDPGRGGFDPGRGREPGHGGFEPGRGGHGDHGGRRIFR